MAKLQQKTSARKRAKFDEAKFFKYLKENADSSLRDFLHSIDKRACVEMSTYLIPYLQRSKEEQVLAMRRRRGAEIQRALSATVRALEKTAAAYKKLGTMEFPGIALLGSPGSRVWPDGMLDFVGVLKAEQEKMMAVLEEKKKLYNEKRLGVSGNHTWLVLLQEFVFAWTELELGEALELKDEDIATLIEAAKIALGWQEDKTHTDPELIRKAISKFRKNQVNARFISQHIVPYVYNRCSVVAQGPLLLGIEI